MTRGPRSPRLARAIFALLIPSQHREAFLADLEEDFVERLSKSGLFVAWVWYWIELMRCRPLWWFRLRRPTTSQATAGFRIFSFTALSSDYRMALRQLRQHPGFAVATIATLAFGIGVNTAVFSVVNQIMLRDPPYQDPDRLVLVWNEMQNTDAARARTSGPDFLDYREQSTMLEGIAGIWSGTTTLTGADRAEQIVEAKVSENIFAILGVDMAIGRGFREGEGSSMDFTTVFNPNQQVTTGVVVLSHGLWQRRFGGEQDVLGRTIHIDGVPAIIVGVLPEHFRVVLPPDAGVPSGVELYEAFRTADLHTNPRQAKWLTVIGRLKPEVTLPQVQAEMDVIAKGLRENHQSHAQVGTQLVVSSLHADAVSHTKTILAALLGAVGFVFLIACANVTGLLLVRGLARRTEMAVRTALGGTPSRLIRQLFVETGFVALVGAVAGLLLARLGVEMLLLLQPDILPVARSVTIDIRVVGYALFLTIIAATLGGVAPAIQFLRLPIASALYERQSTGGREHRWLRSTLTVFQMAMSVVLLVGAVLMARSLMTLRQTDPGFQAERVVTARITLPQLGYLSADSRVDFFRRLLPDLVNLPGVQSVGGVQWVPLEENAEIRPGSYLLQGEDESRWTVNSVMYRAVLPGFFRTLRIPVISGRTFTQADMRPDAPTLAVVDNAFARRAWPDQNPIGKRLQVTRFNVELRDFEPVEVEVIGVVDNVHHASLAVETGGTLYGPPSVWPWTDQLSLLVRTNREPDLVVEQIRHAVTVVDPNVPVSNFRTMNSYLDAAVAPTKFVLDVFTVFALGAVLLTAVGLYSVVAFSVKHRTREIGLRIAFGATRETLLTLVMTRSVVLAVTGVALGIAGAWVLGGILQSQLVGVSARDPVTLVGVSVTMFLVAMAASFLPARRATRIDAMEALRSE